MWKILVRSAPFALLAIALAGGAAGAQEAAAVRGVVVSDEGQPVAGARVRLLGGGARATSDRGGRFLLSPVPAGDYTVRVEAAGFDAAQAGGRVGVGETATLDVVLAPTTVALEGIEVVSATRSSTPIAAIPGAVTVVGRERIDEGVTVSRGIGEILGKEVPGLAVGTQSMSNYGQTLRGRSVAVLIDGVPQSTLRNVSRDFVNIDPAMIERVEVLRGATAIYGDGATGGVINIITRRPAKEGVRVDAEALTRTSLSNTGGGTGGRFSLGASGRSGALDYVARGTWDRTGGLYDAEGDLIPADPHGQGGIADTDGRDLFGRLGWSFGVQRLELTANHFRSEQDTRFTADPSVNALPPGEAKARALPGLREDRPQGTRNTLLNLDYTHAEVLGSRVHAQLYGRDYLTRFRGFDRRRYNPTTGELVGGQVSQSFIDSEKWGGRLEAESPLFRGASLLWGADYTAENTSQPVTLIDPDVYDASGGLVFQGIGDRTWVPPLRPRSLGVFGQLGWKVGDRLFLRGGVRRERIRMSVDDFVTLDDNQVFGGDLAYDPTLFNAGATLQATGALNLYANVSQGFSLADVGRILRAAPDSFDLGANDLEAQKVNQQEVGLRAAWTGVQGSLALFRNSSELGTRLVEAESGMLEVARAPERVRGVEATLDVQPAAQWGIGGTWSWVEGEAFNAKVDEYRALDGYRIQPPKLTAYAEYAPSGRWDARLQLLRSGSRDRAFRDRLDPSKPAAYGEQPVTGYTVVDLLGSVRLGPGKLQLGVQNLLNEQYFDTVSQLDLTDGNAYYTAAPGANLSVGYSVTY